MYVCTSSDIRDWVPKPGLNRSIERFFDKLSKQDGTFWSSYARDSIFSKYADPSPESADERELAAYNKLWATEINNAETNRRLRFTHTHDQYIHTASMKIKEILGDCDLNRIYKCFDFSNGASHAFSTGNSNAYNKFDSRSFITHEALPYLDAFYKSSQLLKREAVIDLLYDKRRGKLKPGQVYTSSGNKLFTVPKNDKIDRVCAKEPDWNMFFQKGFGKYIRRSLKEKSGIDLNDQSINQSLAREGSITNQLATLDLSAASDSITTELVYKLLPPCFFKHLDALRSKTTIKEDGSCHKWQLFSTMGNGFTFELESLIFYSLAWSVCYLHGIKGRISIYGDDIICPVGACEPLIALLNYCGFSVNKDKSFTEGPFRESCGGHYYNGFDVTPIYIKRPIESLHDFILFRNKFLMWSSNFGHKYHLVDPRCRQFLAFLDSQLGKFSCLCSPDTNISGFTIISNSFGGYRLTTKNKSKGFSRRGAYCYTMFKASHRDKIANEPSVPVTNYKLVDLKNTEFSISTEVAMSRSLELKVSRNSNVTVISSVDWVLST